jgi:hypothetical protein
VQTLGQTNFYSTDFPDTPLASQYSDVTGTVSTRRLKVCAYLRLYDQNCAFRLLFNLPNTAVTICKTRLNTTKSSISHAQFIYAVLRLCYPRPCTLTTSNSTQYALPFQNVQCLTTYDRQTPKHLNQGRPKPLAVWGGWIDDPMYSLDVRGCDRRTVTNIGRHFQRGSSNLLHTSNKTEQ